MFKITKGFQDNTFNITCYNYISECNFHTFLYSAKNITLDTLASLLQGRLKYIDDLEWIPDIVRLTNQPAIVGNDGLLRAVPVADQRGMYDESETIRRGAIQAKISH